MLFCTPFFTRFFTPYFTPSSVVLHAPRSATLPPRPASLHFPPSSFARPRVSTSRRDFIRTAAAASGALAVGILPDVANAAPREAGERAPRQQRIAPKKIL